MENIYTGILILFFHVITIYIKLIIYFRRFFIYVLIYVVTWLNFLFLTCVTVNLVKKNLLFFALSKTSKLEISCTLDLIYWNFKNNHFLLNVTTIFLKQKKCKPKRNKQIMFLIKKHCKLQTFTHKTQQ